MGSGIGGSDAGDMGQGDIADTGGESMVVAGMGLLGLGLLVRRVARSRTA